jgi:LacI family transcriptional regulator
MAVVGHDDREFAQVVRPALSTVRLPCYEMGQAAVRMIRQRLESDEPVPALLVRGELIVRDSCGGRGASTSPPYLTSSSASPAHREKQKEDS